MGVALTFDDGPDPAWTPRVLDALDACGVRATFFVMGHAVERHPQTLAATLAAGHDVQLHCHHHLRHTALNRAQLEADTGRALTVLGAEGVAPTRWRAPWGVLGRDTAAVAARRRLELVGWTTDTEDWAGDAADVLLGRVAGDLHDGAIVLAHDGVGPGARRTDCAETVRLIAPLVATIRAAGLEPGPLPPPDPSKRSSPPPSADERPRGGRSSALDVAGGGAAC